jgi:hypothetical protein
MVPNPSLRSSPRNSNLPGYQPLNTSLEVSLPKHSTRPDQPSRDIHPPPPPHPPKELHLHSLLNLSWTQNEEEKQPQDTIKAKLAASTSFGSAGAVGILQAILQAIPQGLGPRGYCLKVLKGVLLTGRFIPGR